MIVRMGVFQRKEGLDQPQFIDRWRQGHGPVARGALSELTQYVQNLVTDRAQRSIEYDRLELDVDGISQLYFPDLGALRRSTSAAAINNLAEDEARFMQNLVVLTALQNVIIAPPAESGTLVKRMSLLRKRPDVSAAEFQMQWFDMHATLVRRIPGVRGYRQNLVIETRRDRFDPADNPGDVGIDGVVELWFDSTDAIEAGFRSPQGLTTMAHAEEFLANISTYMVDPYVVP